MKLGNYEVKFYHSKHEETNARTTTCEVTKPSGSLLIGMARCNNKEDIFSKKKGRLISLRRAIGITADDFVPREDRIIIWGEYLNGGRNRV
jgi:hypothetical protein